MLFYWIGLLFLALITLPAQQKDERNVAQYYPTPEIVVDKMLQMAAVKPGEKVYDLGSGDGRIVIMAARKYKADAVGIELDENAMADKLNHDWRNQESYDAEDGSVVDW